MLEVDMPRCGLTYWQQVHGSSVHMSRGS